MKKTLLIVKTFILITVLAMTNAGTANEEVEDLAEQMNRQFQQDKINRIEAEKRRVAEEKQHAEDVKRGKELLEQLQPRLVRSAYLGGEQVLKGFVLDQLRDPSSAHFRNLKFYQQKPSGMYVLCGFVNAKNAFGGYIGFKRFVSISAGSVVIHSNMNSDEANNAISQICDLPVTAK